MFIYEGHRVKVEVTGTKKRYRASVIWGRGDRMTAPSSEYR